MSAAPASSPSTGSAWRVLLVDDSPDDAELAEYALRKAGLKVECRRTCTAAGLDAALREFAPHAVVSDLNLPGYSGLEALVQVRAHDPRLPVLILTGAVAPDDDPPAAEALLLKDDLDALPRVLRGLLEAGRAAAVSSRP